MRLDPVFLVEPKPKPPSIPTRRAFLLAGGMFAAGATLGGACGFAAGVVSSGPDTAPSKEEGRPLEPTGDKTLDELRRLAVEAPIEELVGQWQVFLGLLSDTYPTDEVLWTGAERIGRHVVANERLSSRRTLARWLEQVIMNSRTPAARDLRGLAAELRRVR